MYVFNPTQSKCYDPNYLQCMGSYQVCVENTRKTRQYVGKHIVSCIRDPSKQEFIEQSTSSPQISNFFTPMSLSSSSTITRSTSASFGYCIVRECTTNIDYCDHVDACQCFRHKNPDYGSRLNPKTKSICAR
ncbi:hypothetical protein I4U23_013035 [Adineta vaga]|nr:hypothetical protein I4U23_013035 [Adineta vaga]